MMCNRQISVFVIVVKSMKIEVKQTYVKFSEDLNSQ